MAAVLSRLKHQKRYSSQRGIAVFVDLQKAYDTVPRDRMIMNLWKDASSDEDRQLVSIITNLHLFQKLKIGERSVQTFRGVAQGSVLSPLLFNKYLNQALRSSHVLSSALSRGDLIAYADDIVILT